MSKYLIRRIILSVVLILIGFGLYNLISPTFGILSASMWLFFAACATIATFAFEWADVTFNDGDSWIIIHFCFIASACAVFTIASWIVSFFQ